MFQDRFPPLLPELYVELQLEMQCAPHSPGEGRGGWLASLLPEFPGRRQRLKTVTEEVAEVGETRDLGRQGLLVMNRS
jgi:hypothetical protein